ncbi:MAG: XRE family transcriptional regulator [Ralstonia sp.]|uniref:helix-turn-helix domain-containing protein n=1 Tax=Ralstonia sp. TaxID=54061 RepID=UPI000D2D2EB9|nr:helix-turn-helix transcriptional regulator [Ralstonia sp.]MBA4173722.1 XRE family transcriptional regulator [Hyphomicrobium sp.]MBA4233897.1 XRE family transcriptional regulator [Ralstonia sp.]PPC80489.1 MAG: transcriptional regulator [Hyphomicrobium sp.]
MSLAVKLKQLRIARGKSLQELADEVGASKAHIWDLETGRSSNPSIELLTKLAKALKASIADLVGENPTGEAEDPQIVAMYRELKDLTPEDRDAIQSVIDRFKNRKKPI